MKSNIDINFEFTETEVKQIIADYVNAKHQLPLTIFPGDVRLAANRSSFSGLDEITADVTCIDRRILEL